MGGGDNISDAVFTLWALMFLQLPHPLWQRSALPRVQMVPRLPLPSARLHAHDPSITVVPVGEGRQWERSLTGANIRGKQNARGLNNSST